MRTNPYKNSPSFSLRWTDSPLARGFLKEIDYFDIIIHVLFPEDHFVPFSTSDVHATGETDIEVIVWNAYCTEEKESSFC